MTISSRAQVFNIYKPANIGSFDVVRSFKRKFQKNLGKIGHFGTLDPFADGVLLIAVGGAARLNELVHTMPKTYVATGVLGLQTETGDLTVAPAQRDEGLYLKEVIAKMDVAFIQEQLRGKFLGRYLQAPHKYSAAKFQGKKLHQWAREGVEIKKEKKERFVHSLNVLSYDFPELTIEVQVSSGTYIRSLFEDCAQHLGTLGTLKTLSRVKVGHHELKESIKLEDLERLGREDFLQLAMSPDEVLLYPELLFAAKEARLLANGVALEVGRHSDGAQPLASQFYWAKGESGELIGLIKIENGKFKSQLNFSSNS